MRTAASRSRRAFQTVARVGMVLGLMTAGAAIGPVVSSAEAQAASRPNILLILSDDQRRNLSMMPATQRWFRAGGTEFPRGYVVDPLCCPSRASILTGRYPHNHGVIGNTLVSALDQETTLLRWLQGAGYRTGVFGKFLNAWTAPVPHADRYAEFPDASFGYGLDTADWNINGTLTRVKEYGADAIADRAVFFMRSSEDRPFFVYLAPANPHAPYTPAPRDTDAVVPPYTCPPSAVETDRSDKPAYVRDNDAPVSCATSKRIRTEQLRAQISLDRMVDRVMTEAYAAGEDTLAFYLSDNGYQWGEHGLKGKSHMYQESVEVPFFVRWPGHFTAGATDQRWAANIDIAPTAYEAAGVTPSNPIDGDSLLRPATRPYAFIEYFKSALASGYDTPTWEEHLTSRHAYARYRGAGGINFREYYDRAADPWQLENLFANGVSADNPDVGRLDSALDSARTCSGSGCA